MFKSLLIFSTILIAQGTSAQERVWPDVKMSCRTSSLGGESNLQEREHIVYIYPRRNELIITDRGLRRLQTEDLKTTQNSYAYIEPGGPLEAQPNRFEIDRTTLEFSFSYKYGASSYYSAVGKCIVVAPII